MSLIATYIFDNPGPDYTPRIGTGGTFSLAATSGGNPKLYAENSLGGSLQLSDSTDDNGIVMPEGAPSANFDFTTPTFSILLDFIWNGVASAGRLVEKGHTAGPTGWAVLQDGSSPFVPQFLTTNAGGTSETDSSVAISSGSPTRLICVADNGAGRI
jgi:hypothetical protein